MSFVKLYEYYEKSNQFSSIKRQQTERKKRLNQGKHNHNFLYSQLLLWVSEKTHVCSLGELALSVIS